MVRLPMVKTRASEWLEQVLQMLMALVEMIAVLVAASHTVTAAVAAVLAFAHHYHDMLGLAVAPLDTLTTAAADKVLGCMTVVTVQVDMILVVH